MDSQKPYKYILWTKEFLEEKNIIANLTAISFDELNQLLKRLDKGTKVGDFAFNELVEICFKIVCRVPIFVVKVDVPYVVRCRPNNNLQVFKNVSELSYNPFEEKIDYGRFNLKREPMFYGVTPSKPKNDFPEELATILETCKDLRDEDIVIPANRYVTLSYWKIVKPFFAVILSLYDDGICKNLTLESMHTYFESIFENKFTPESRKIISTLYRYLSNKASCLKERNSDYLITTAFRHALEKYYGQEVRAIIYSGADSDNHCINIALTKATVDEKYIEIDRAIMYVINPRKKIKPFSEFAFPLRDDYFIFNPAKRY